MRKDLVKDLKPDIVDEGVVDGLVVGTEVGDGGVEEAGDVAVDDGGELRVDRLLDEGAGEVQGSGRRLHQPRPELYSSNPIPPVVDQLTASC